MIRTFRLLLAALFLAGASFAQAPRIFFTDLSSGPNTGGENNNGAFVTIYGNNFGTSQGASTVTVGGSAVASYRIWGAAHLWYQKIVVQLGPNAKTGNIVVTTSAGSSNAMPFTVRAGNIYFASKTGSDSAAGSFAAPFASVIKCKNALKAGDICYVMDGIVASAVDDYAAAVVLGTPGTAATPLALLTYPGANVTLGNGSNARGVYPCSGLGSCSNGIYWIVGGFHIRASTLGIYTTVGHLYFVGNEVQCPSPGSGVAAACVESVENIQDITLRGNEVSNVGAGGKLYHGVYLSVYQSDIFDVSWNKVHDISGCRGIQITADSGSALQVTVHDNLVYNTRCDGINVGSVNNTNNAISVYNNLVYHAGAGPDLGAVNSCLNVDGHPTAATPVPVYNNTFYDCGAPNTSDSGMVSIQIPSVLKNNIIYSTGSTERYYVYGTANVTGSNNLYFGNGSGPAQTTGNINADPKFVNLAGRDFHLLASSLALNAGTTVPIVVVDREGIARPQGGTFDIGAYETYAGSATQPPPNPCDTNGDGSVNQPDIDSSVSQALGTAACKTDLDANGRCDVVDVQRVINAVMGHACRVGQ